MKVVAYEFEDKVLTFDTNDIEQITNSVGVQSETESKPARRHLDITFREGTGAKWVKKEASNG